MEETTRPFFVRRHFFVKKGLQGRWVLAVVGAALFSFAMIFFDYYITFGRNAGWDLRMLEIFLRSQTLPMIQLAVFVVVLAVMTVLLSHRVAGPLINLEKSLARLAEGDLTHRIRLRRKDQLKDIRDAYNRTADALRAKIVDDRSRAEDALQRLESVSKEIQIPLEKQIEMRKAIDLLNHLTKNFKL